MRCPCGSAILVPTPRGAGEEEAGEYDFAEPVARRPAAYVAPAAAAAASAAPAAALVGLAAAPGAADTPLPGAGPVIRADVPPQRRGLRPEERKCDDEIAPPSTLRDLVVPTVLILLGVGLRFVEVLSPFATREPMGFGPGAPSSQRWC
jgi:hypothetical protein